MSRHYVPKERRKREKAWRKGRHKRDPLAGEFLGLPLFEKLVSKKARGPL